MLPTVGDTIARFFEKNFAPTHPPKTSLTKCFSNLSRFTGSCRRPIDPDLCTEIPGQHAKAYKHCDRSVGAELIERRSCRRAGSTNYHAKRGCRYSVGRAERDGAASIYAISVAT